ncbi:MAG: PrsW family intramembrane metalloprotease, partial [Nocardioidaceae bacterium]
VFVWLDRLRPEPPWLLAVALLWGALGAASIAVQLNEWFAGQVGDISGPSARSAVFVAPWVEESAKGVVVFAIVWWRRHDFNSVIAGVVYGGLSGVGFAFTENIYYYGQLFQQVKDFKGSEQVALDAVEHLFLWRGVAMPFVHPMFTMMTGVGIGLAVRYRHVGVRILAPVAGFCAAVLLHMGYNGAVSFADNRELTAVYIVILLPTLMLLLGLVLTVRRRERRVIAARLRDYTTFGWLKAEHIDYIASARGRREARRNVKRLGKVERERVRQYQQAGMNLGLLRDRLVRGVAGHKELTRERELIATMRAFRGQVILPVPDEAGVQDTARASSSW